MLALGNTYTHVHTDTNLSDLTSQDPVPSRYLQRICKRKLTTPDEIDDVKKEVQVRVMFRASFVCARPHAHT